MSAEDRVIVLRDKEGNTYLLPWDVVEAAQVPPDQIEAVEDVLVDDVGGFSVRPSFFDGRLLTAGDFQQEQGALRGPLQFDLPAHLSRVRRQQGRVGLDGDWP